MNAAMKAALATVAVAALMLSSVGVTYSWFSASQEYTVNIGTGTFEVSYTLLSDDGTMEDNTVHMENGAPNKLTLSVKNDNDVPVAFEASFTVPRYAAYTSPDHSGTSYAGDLSPTGQDSYSLDSTLTDQHRDGFRERSMNALSVDFSESGPLTLTGTNSTFTTIIDGTTYYVVETEYSASYNDVILPNSIMNIPITVNTTRTVGTETYTYTAGSTLNPVISAKAVQINSTGSVAEAELVRIGDAYNGMFDLSDLNGRTSLVFSDIGDRIRVTVDWQSLNTPELARIGVLVTESTNGMSILVYALDSSNVDVQLEGRVDYSISIGDKGITSVMSGGSSVSCMVTEDENGSTVTFSDIGSRTSHTIGLTGGS